MQNRSSRILFAVFIVFLRAECVCFESKIPSSHPLKILKFRHRFLPIVSKKC
ncbi:hypothetical protein CAMGR0001_2154 [Campylobacter gracilis RM3268]|uniref:Uncharacterized protein n=1 Tax=Campylobacter gracilis RM3268 TaxID=553220 RepID=C8PDR5_9BACT|nr:hypothetical protein CAMGR0001_2154 [Campylobacter gracilis RM3268]